MFRYWRAAVLIVLMVGPIVAYIGFGAFWLAQRGWLLYATSIWITSGIVFSILAARWTRLQTPLMPPIDWDSPHSFAPHDRKAWELVQEEAARGDMFSLDDLSSFDVYSETGKRLAQRLAAHYHPLSHDPLDNVPFVELLTALELAAEDLDHLCRQVPGGDLVTPAHWKRAVQAAEYLNWANDIYTYFLPIIQPLTGLVRLGTQKLMVKPAWRNMRQNLLRWFYQAYVNRLGTHLVELFSGRLAIGADQYRRLSRKFAQRVPAVNAEPPPLTIAVAGARDVGKSQLIEALEKSRTRELPESESRHGAPGFDVSVSERLRTAQWVETPGYTVARGEETARDRSTRRAAVEAAVEADLLLLVIDGSHDAASVDVRFAQAWDQWYVEHPAFEVPPAVAVVIGIDRPEWGGEWCPPYDWTSGRSAREIAVRARLEALRSALPPTIPDIVAVGLRPQSPYGVREQLLPVIASHLHRAERTALIRFLQHTSTRSKAGRLISQVGQHARRIWTQLRSGRQHPEKVA